MRALLRALLLASVILAPGCMTIVSFAKGRPPHTPRAESHERDLVFGGVRGWSHYFSRKLLDRSRDLDDGDDLARWWFGVLGLVDLPLCFSLDLVALPVTLAVSEGQDATAPAVAQQNVKPKRQKLRRRR